MTKVIINLCLVKNNKFKIHLYQKSCLKKLVFIKVEALVPIEKLQFAITNQTSF